MADYELIADFDGDLKGGTEARKYPDGSIRNERGYWLIGHPGRQMITSETAREIGQIARDNKRRAIAAGANAIVDQGLSPSGSNLIGDHRFVEAIAEAQAIKALNPDDSKATDAARFLLQEAGLSERRADAVRSDQDNETDAEIKDMLRALLDTIKENVGDNYSYRNQSDDSVPASAPDPAATAPPVKAGKK